jgi:hypothetical protein
LRYLILAALLLSSWSLRALAEELPYTTGQVHLGMAEEDYRALSIGQRTADPNPRGHQYWRLVPFGGKNWGEVATFVNGVLESVLVGNGFSVKTSSGSQHIGDDQFLNLDRVSCLRKVESFRAEIEKRFGKTLQQVPQSNHWEGEGFVDDMELFRAQFGDRSLNIIDSRWEKKTTEGPTGVVKNRCSINFIYGLDPSPSSPTMR